MHRGHHQQHHRRVQLPPADLPLAADAAAARAPAAARVQVHAAEAPTQQFDSEQLLAQEARVRSENESESVRRVPSTELSTSEMSVG